MRTHSSQRRVTLHDIANETGYSINTVSHALRNMTDISPATRERFQQVARDMGYMGNQIASSLRSGRTKTIAVVLGNLTNPYYSIMADHIQTAADLRGYSLMITCSREDPAQELAQAESAIARRVDGILLFPTNESTATIERLRALRFPFVLMSRSLGLDTADSVVTDEETGAYLAARHILEHGCRNPLYISRQYIVYSYEKRLAGFIRACEEYGIPQERRHIFLSIPRDATDPSSRDWQASTRTALQAYRDQGVDGIFAFCDSEAWQLQTMIQEDDALRGWRYAMVGFDNIQKAQQYPSPLCSIDCSYSEMALEAIDLLRSRIHGDTSAPKTIVCPVQLACRESCAI